MTKKIKYKKTIEEPKEDELVIYDVKIEYEDKIYYGYIVNTHNTVVAYTPELSEFFVTTLGLEADISYRVQRIEKLRPYKEFFKSETKK